jgi:signal transduction histidine kinase
MSFGIVMAQLYISTLLSGSATRYFHYDEDGTNILHPIKEVEMLRPTCFTVSPTAATLF